MIKYPPGSSGHSPKAKIEGQNGPLDLKQESNCKNNIYKHSNSQETDQVLPAPLHPSHIRDSNYFLT